MWTSHAAHKNASPLVLELSPLAPVHSLSSTCVPGFDRSRFRSEGAERDELERRRVPRLVAALQVAAGVSVETAHQRAGAAVPQLSPPLPRHDPGVAQPCSCFNGLPQSHSCEFYAHLQRQARSLANAVSGVFKESRLSVLTSLRIMNKFMTCATTFDISSHFSSRHFGWRKIILSIISSWVFLVCKSVLNVFMQQFRTVICVVSCFSSKVNFVLRWCRSNSASCSVKVQKFSWSPRRKSCNVSFTDKISHWLILQELQPQKFKQSFCAKLLVLWIQPDLIRTSVGSFWHWRQIFCVVVEFSFHQPKKAPWCFASK